MRATGRHFERFWNQRGSSQASGGFVAKMEQSGEEGCGLPWTTTADRPRGTTSAHTALDSLSTFSTVVASQFVRCPPVTWQRWNTLLLSPRLRVSDLVTIHCPF